MSKQPPTAPTARAVNSQVTYYSIRVLAGLIISSYVIYFISDGQTEGGLRSIQPEARGVVSPLLYV